MPWFTRCPVKCSVLALVTLTVCFPYPGRLLRHIDHWRNPHKLIEPDEPSLQPLLEELRPKLGENPHSLESLKIIERFVYERVPYEWDWNTWGMADYLPTAGEILASGREDCDGRAVVAASILAHFGFEPQIVTDFSHVWVKTKIGEAMGPGEQKAIVSSGDGLAIRWRGLLQIPRALAFGASVFPLAREIIILFVFWLLLLDERVPASRRAVSILVLVAGLLFLRAGGESYRHPIYWLQFVGLLSMSLGTFVAFWTKQAKTSE